MPHKNIFDGDSFYAQFAQVIYKCLMSRNWVTNADIMADYMGLNSASELPYSISKCDHIKELSKALMDIKDLLGGLENFEEERIGQSKRIRYIGENNDPLADMRNAKVISSLKQYWQFCQDSAGFFPSSWLEYFFKDSRDLLDIRTKRKKGEQVLSASLDRMLTNIEMLPSLYEAIVHQQVLSICYKPYEEEERTLTIHPHYIKEFNGRWHLFGHAEEQYPEYGYDIALDRICSNPRELYNVTYKPAPHGFYETFFRDIVGVSHKTDDKGQPYKVQAIHVRAHNYYMYKLTETKKIHWSQEIFYPFGEYDDGTYGEFVISVELNNEFIGRILQMGSGLEIVAPLEVRKVFQQRTAELAKLYENIESSQNE